jgi:hypothetical protein
MDTIPIAMSAFLLVLNAVFPDLISRYDANTLRHVLDSNQVAMARPGPAAMKAPIASDSGIESNPIPRRIPSLPPLRSAI